MKIGVVLPLAPDPAAPEPTWPRIAAVAGRAEAAGLDSLWVFDHLLFRSDGEPDAGIHEAWTMLAAVAATTRTVELGTIVMATPFRPPALFAKMAAAVDTVAGGRLILGLGCGWHEPEFRAFGYPFDHRVGRFEEAIDVILPLLRGERVTYNGRWTQAADAILLPPPVRMPPILIAARGERMLRLAAQHADAWNAAWFGLPDDRYRERRATLVAACEAHGRDPATMAVTIGLTVAGAGATVSGGSVAADRRALADALGAWEADGVDHLILSLTPEDDASFDAVFEAVADRRGEPRDDLSRSPGSTDRP